MIPSFIRRFFTLRYDYDSIIEQQRAQRLLYINGFILLTTIIWTVIFSVPGMMAGQFELEQIASPIILVATIMLQALIQRGQVLWASRIFVALLFLTNVVPQINNPNSPQLISVMLPIILAGVLLNRTEILAVTTLITIVVLRGTLITDEANALSLSAALGFGFTIFLSGVFLAVFNSSLEEITKSAGDLIIKTRKLGQRRSQSDTDSIEDIVGDAINHLRNRLNYNYVRVVMLDDNEEPTTAYYSSIGVEQIARTNNFNFTSNSAFQQSLNDRTLRIIQQRDPGNISAHLLPSSNSGVVIPAQSFGQVVALFDIQSENIQPIEPELANVLELFVEQVAGTLAYQRITSALRSDILEQQNIINQQRTLLETMQVSQTEGIVTDWQYYLQQRGLESIGYDINDKRQISTLEAGDIPEDLRQSFEGGKVIVQPVGDNQNVIIPIQFRETVVGAISFQIPQEIPITDRKLDFIRSVTERLALALDNKRLLEQTQIQAQRESTANEIGSVLLSSTDVQSVLQTAVSRFNEALGAVSTRIYLQPSTLETADREQREDTV